MKFKGLLGLLIVGVFALAFSAQAATLTINLDGEFSGGDSPSGDAPWLKAVFDDEGTAGTVKLTLTSLLQDSQEFVKEWYFNFNPAKDVGGLTFAFDSKIGTFTNPTVDTGVNAFKADGDGFFDILFSFAVAPPGDRFGEGDVYTVLITGAGITAADFNFASVNGPEGKTGFLSAAHVLGIDGSGSGWIADVPEPASLALLGAGLLGLAWIRRRRTQ